MTTSSNPGSPKQVAKLLFNKLDLEMPKTEDGKENTRAETLEVLMVGQHPMVQLILDFRGPLQTQILHTWLRSGTVQTCTMGTSLRSGGWLAPQPTA